MPVVPRLSQTSVDQKPIPGVKSPTDVSVEAFGGGNSLQRVGQAGRALAETGLDIYESEMRKADQIAIRDTELAAAEITNEVEAGIRGMKGKDAGNAPDYINEQWSKGTEKLALTFKNDNQRIAGEQILRGRRIQLEETGQIHMANEFKRYNDQQHGVAMDSKRNEGSMKYNRPGAIVNSIFEQEKEIDRYVETTPGLPEGWAESEKSKARSATYRDVLERMEVDGNHELAKQYEKGINKYILPDDVAILDKVRKEEKVRQELLDSEFERQAYLLFRDSEEPDSRKFKTIENALSAGRITLPQSEKMKKWVLDRFNQPEIDYDKKSEKMFQAFEKLEKLGIEINKNMPSSESEGNSLKDITETRKWLAENKKYLKSDFYEKAIDATQSDFDAAREPKWNMFNSFKQILPMLPNLGPATQIDLMQRGFAIFDKKVPPQQAADTVAKLKDEAIVSGNPKRSRYAVGQRVTNPQGIDLEVVGYDDAGNPRFKVLK